MIQAVVGKVSKERDNEVPAYLAVSFSNINWKIKETKESLYLRVVGRADVVISLTSVCWGFSSNLFIIFESPTENLPKHCGQQMSISHD